MIGGRIRAERILWGMSQEDLAEVTGIARDKISRIETGDRRVGADELLRLAEAFQTQPEALAAQDRSRVYRRVNPELAETREAIDWFMRCVDNSLFVRGLSSLYGD